MTGELSTVCDTDDYPLRPATFISCHAQPVQERFVCDICGDVTDSAGCKLGREVMP